MTAHDAYPPPDESLARLRHSGWTMSQTGFTDELDRHIYQVEGSNGDNRIIVEASTPDEAWHRAVLAAAACGMLQD